MTGAHRGRLALGLVLLLGGPAVIAAGADRAAAHPSCTYAQPFRSVAKSFRHVVRAKRAVQTVSRTPERWTGRIILTELRFIKWPKHESRPVSLTVDFDYKADESCPYYPDSFHRYFVLDRAGGKFAIVNSAERRRG